jgi:hypothetical protein
MSTTRPTGNPGGLDDQYPNVESTRRGAHRARPTPLMAALPAVAVVVVVVLVAFGVYSLLGGAGGGGSDDGGPAAGAEVSPSVSSGASPSPSADTEKSPDSGDETAQDPEPDKTVKVTVLNNTGTSGLAKAGQAKLEGDGWNVVAIGDHKPRGSVPTTTVFYATEEQKVTAEAIAQAIGVGGVEESSEIAGDDITVVLSTDFTP